MAKNGETMETVTDFIFLGSKITADGDCSHEIKRLLLLGRKAMINLDSMLKSREKPDLDALFPCKNAAEYVFTNCDPAALFSIKSHIKHRSIPVEKQNGLQSFSRIGFEEAEHLCI